MQDLFIRRLIHNDKFFPRDFKVTDDLPAEIKLHYEISRHFCQSNFRSSSKTKIENLYDQLGSMLKEDAMEAGYRKIC